MIRIGLLVAIFICLLAIPANSQVNFKPGFIITIDHDTVFGKIDYKIDKRMTNACSFKTKTSGKKTYFPGEIVGYLIENERYFESTSIDGKLKFLEVLIKGELSVYYYYDDRCQSYFLKKADGKLKEIKYDEQVVYFDGSGGSSDGKEYNFANNGYKGGYLVKSGESEAILSDSLIDEPDIYAKNRFNGNYLVASQEFKKILAEALKDEPDIYDDIVKLKKPSHQELITLAKKYNELKASTKKTIVYHNLHKKTDYIFSIGWININYREFWKYKSFLIYSFKGTIFLANRKIYLGYGIQYSPVNFTFHSSNRSYKLFRIPLSIGYQYPGNWIKPHVALGLNFYRINSASTKVFIDEFVPSYSIGCAVKIHRDIHLTFNLEGDRLNSSYNSSQTAAFSQTKNIGLMISL